MEHVLENSIKHN